MGSGLDFVGCLDDHKLTFGYILMMTRGFMPWKNNRQSITVISTMEVEYVACYETIREVVWLRNLITCLFIVVESILRPLIIYCDDTVAMSLSQNNKNFACTKHFDIKYQFVRENICEHVTFIKHISINKMLTDPLTKGLTIGIYHDHVINIGLAKPFIAQGQWEYDIHCVILLISFVLSQDM